MTDISTFQGFLDNKQRNKIKKQVRYQHPELFGKALDREVDRVMGIAKSGKMDWAMVGATITPPSNYMSPDDIGLDEIVSVASEYSMRPYILYWFFVRKLQTLQADGREKNDYLALLKLVASTSVKKTLTDDEKIPAIQLFAKNIKHIEISVSDIEFMIFKGEI
jgi:hypothetical protein